MKIFHTFLATMALAFCLQAQTVTPPEIPKNNALLVYDSIDATSKIYIEAFRAQIEKKGIHCDEIALFKNESKDIAHYEYILIYSRVLAFNWMFPVKKWVKTLGTLENKKVFVFATANRWFNKKNMEQIVDLVNKKKGTLVDAVSMATKTMTNEQRIESVAKHLSKLGEN